MKKIKLLLVFVLMISFLCLTGCTKKYTVTFETNCDQVVETQEVIENEKVVKPQELIKEGYKFLGWFNGDVEYTFEEPVTSDLVLTAKWEEIFYNVTFETNSESKVNSQNIKENGKVTKPQDPTKEGFEFLGWFSGDKLYDFNQAVTSDLVLTAKWEEIVYTVTFETNSDTVIEELKLKVNEKVTKPQDPVKEGYKFLGWFNGDTEYNFDEVVSDDLVLTAKWEEIKKYTIKFIADGKEVATYIVEEGKDSTVPQAPKIEGMLFVRWEGNFTNVTADAEVVAVYEKAVYSVEFRVDGKTHGSISKVEHGKDAVAPQDPVKEGYKFVGWDKEFTNVTSYLVVNAEFEAIEYSIKYYFTNIELTTIEPKKYTIEDTIVLGEHIVKDYYFYGWYDNSNFEGQALNEIPAGTTGDITLYALNVKVDFNGGSESWTTEFPSSHDAGKGIDEISNLPEIFEMDFFKYLSDNNLLADERIDSTCVASSWAVFSGVNPLHNGDPKRIWNDTSSNVSGGADGYVSVFLYETIELNDDLTVKNVSGGFLGTEPYKTKYRGVLNHLVTLYQYKVENNNYTDLSANTDASRALMGFVIDGYFYGTQGASSGYFKAARSVIPGVNFSYKISGDTIEKITYNDQALPTPVRDGYVFAGWCLDKECTKLISENKPTSLCTLYAKWEEMK